jgi:uracil-DNA glycosylase
VAAAHTHRAAQILILAMAPRAAATTTGRIFPGPLMEASDLKRLPSRVLTFRDEQQVIAEDVETELAARAR